MLPEFELIQKHVFEFYGGKDKFFAAAEQQHRDILAHWAQEIDVIGRILRAHLFVEFFIERALLRRNPNLGSIERARLSFHHKLELLFNGPDLPGIDYLLPGLRRLNTIRNRIAHTLHADLSVDDAKAFLNIRRFKAMRAQQDNPQSPNDEPLVVLEDFAKHAGFALQAVASGAGAVWAEAIRRAEVEMMDRA